MKDFSSYTDRDLLSLLRESNHTAYTEIYERYSGILYLHAYNKLRNREEAKDILQELFTNIWNRREELRIETSLSGYLYTAIRNRILKQMASKDVEAQYIASVTKYANQWECITDHLTRQNQLATIIENEIESLPAKMKEVFLLSRKTHLSHRQIALRLGITEATAKKQVNNALKILRARLGLFAWLLLFIKF
ncbi:sigma-70 family RNA polymerase sigma factor [Mucilaginibacter sp.]|uniref:RNA polymerase sigma factor n=1 Tax=Mucilaginibacter sp. TaxID=1882438 RepID=UPI0026008C14|nr:sigma-70 family RNA polymerase sigma factor [Mucilaginibacter sp.]